MNCYLKVTVSLFVVLMFQVEVQAQETHKVQEASSERILFTHNTLLPGNLDSQGDIYDQIDPLTLLTVGEDENGIFYANFGLKNGAVQLSLSEGKKGWFRSVYAHQQIHGGYTAMYDYRPEPVLSYEVEIDVKKIDPKTREVTISYKLVGTPKLYRRP